MLMMTARRRRAEEEEEKKGARSESSKNIIIMSDDDEGYDYSRPWKRARLVKPMKVLVLVSALYLLTARNDEVQFCDKPGDGADFIHRLLSSTHEMRVVDALRVNVNVFGILKDSLGEMLAPLKQVKNVMGVDEKLAIALQWMGHGTCARTQRETFQRSPASVLRARHDVLAAIICCLYAKYVKLIRKSTRYAKLMVEKFRPFLGAHGAIDGTHLGIQVSGSNSSRFFGHKQGTTMNYKQGTLVRKSGRILLCRTRMMMTTSNSSTLKCGRSSRRTRRALLQMFGATKLRKSCGTSTRVARVQNIIIQYRQQYNTYCSSYSSYCTS